MEGVEERCVIFNTQDRSTPGPSELTYMFVSRPVPLSQFMFTAAETYMYAWPAPCIHDVVLCQHLQRSTSRGSARPPIHGSDNTHSGCRPLKILVRWIGSRWNRFLGLHMSV
jgi:hypothetical protein